MQLPQGFTALPKFEKLPEAKQLAEAKKLSEPKVALPNLSEQAQELTYRQQEVYVCMLEGLAVAATAKKLEIADKTVKFHRTNIYKHFNVASISQLVAKELTYFRNKAA